MLNRLINCIFNRRNIALLVDGPNILRKNMHIDLMKVKREVSTYGRIWISKVYVNQHAPDKLMEAIKNHGFEIVITTGDVDVTMAVEGMEYITKRDIDIIALMTRDVDFLPVITKAKERGKKTILITTNVASGAAIRNSADVVITFKTNGGIEHTKNP